MQISPDSVGDALYFSVTCGLQDLSNRNADLQIIPTEKKLFILDIKSKKLLYWRQLKYFTYNLSYFLRVHITKEIQWETEFSLSRYLHKSLKIMQNVFIL